MIYYHPAQHTGYTVIFFNLVSDTSKIPVGPHTFGESWAVIASTWPKLDDTNDPRVAVKVGAVGSEGTTERKTFSTLQFLWRPRQHDLDQARASRLPTRDRRRQRKVGASAVYPSGIVLLCDGQQDQKIVFGLRSFLYTPLPASFRYSWKVWAA